MDDELVPILIAEVVLGWRRRANEVCDPLWPSLHFGCMLENTCIERTITLPHGVLAGQKGSQSGCHYPDQAASADWLDHDQILSATSENTISCSSILMLASVSISCAITAQIRVPTS